MSEINLMDGWMDGLSCSVVCVILHLAISLEYLLVTETDRHTTTAYTMLVRHRALKTANQCCGPETSRPKTSLLLIQGIGVGEPSGGGRKR